MRLQNVEHLEGNRFRALYDVGAFEVEVWVDPGERRMLRAPLDFWALATDPEEDLVGLQRQLMSACLWTKSHPS